MAWGGERSESRVATTYDLKSSFRQQQQIATHKETVVWPIFRKEVVNRNYLWKWSEARLTRQILQIATRNKFTN